MKYVKRYTNIQLLETQFNILIDNKQKAGIFMIMNKINNKKYIGSAITNRINVKFRNFFFHGTGSNIITNALKEYGIENFEFYILEYYPGIVIKENLSRAHTELLLLENQFILSFLPEYNLFFPHSSYNSLPLNSSNIEKDKYYLRERKELLSKIASLRNSNMELQNKFNLLKSKPVTLYNKEGLILFKFSSIRAIAKYFNCCNKTIHKAIKEQSFFRNIGFIQFDPLF